MKVKKLLSVLPILLIAFAKIVLAEESGLVARTFEKLQGGIVTAFQWVGDLAATVNPYGGGDTSAALGFLRIGVFAIIFAVCYFGMGQAFKDNEAINKQARIALSVIIALLSAVLMPSDTLKSTASLFRGLGAFIIHVLIHVGVFISILRFNWPTQRWWQTLLVVAIKGSLGFVYFMAMDAAYTSTGIDYWMFKGHL